MAYAASGLIRLAGGSGFNFWADKLQMVDTYEETGYEYGTTVDCLFRLVRRKSRGRD